MYGKHNTLWCSQLLCHVYVLWQSLNHGSLQTMGRDPQSGGRKDFRRASFPNPRMAARHQHPHWCPVPSKQGNIWLTKLHSWAQGMWYHSRVMSTFQGFQWALQLLRHLQQFDLRKDRLLELHKIIVNYLKRKENSMRIKIHISPKCWYNDRSCS